MTKVPAFRGDDYGARLAASYAAAPGRMPFGKYKGLLFRDVVKGAHYVEYLEARWRFGLPDPPQMIAEIRRLCRSVAVEHIEGCTIYRPAAWSGG